MRAAIWATASSTFAGIWAGICGRLLSGGLFTLLRFRRRERRRSVTVAGRGR